MRNGSVDGTARRLLDTNILVYQHDARDHEKQRRAHDVARRAASQRGTALSSQVLAEFAAVTTRTRAPLLTPENAGRQVALLGRQFRVFPVTAPCVVEGLRGVAAHQLSFWDSLLWAVARLNQVPVILTEDLPGGRASVEGVRYVNPLEPGFDVMRIGLDL